MKISLTTLLLVIWSLSLRAEKPALLLEGRDKTRGGFQYWLLTDKNGEPLRSLVNKSPIYQGILPPRNSSELPVTINESLQNLLENGRIVNSILPKEELPWAKNITQVEVGFGIIQKLFDDWSKNRESFKKFFANSSDLKANIFSQLLFEPVFQLNLDSLNSLKSGAFNPDPEPIRIAISFPAFILTETYFDIYVSKLDLSFKRKAITFNLEEQSLDVEVDLDKANLSGMIHGIGRVKVISDYFNLEDGDDVRWNPNFWSKKAVLVGAEMEPMSVRFSLKLLRDTEGFWRIQLYKPLRLTFNSKTQKPKVIIKMVDTKYVKIANGNLIYDEKYIGRREEKLDAQQIERIEKTLSEPLESALGNAFFPEDFGFQIPLSPLKNELKPGLSKVQLQLSDLKWGDKKIALSFDGRVRVFEQPDCVQSLVSDDNDWNLHGPSIGNVQKTTQSFRFQSDESQNFAWKFIDANGKSEVFESEIKLKIPEVGAQFMLQSAVVSGLACLSSRSIWPRPDYLPLIEFQATKFPKLKLEDNYFTADIFGNLFIFQRNLKNASVNSSVNSDDDILNEQLIASKAGEFSLKFPIHNNNEKKELSWAMPFDAHVKSWNEEENESLNKSLALASAQLSNLDFIPLQFSYEFLSYLVGSSQNIIGDPEYRPWLRDIQLNPSEILINLGLGASPYKAPNQKEISADFGSIEEVKAPLTVFKRKYFYGNSLNLVFNEDSNNPQLYSWRVKSTAIDSNRWSNWTAFAAIDGIYFPMKDEGRYIFQVKAQNRLYQIESKAVEYETYYAPTSTVAIKSKTENKTTESVLENESKASEDGKSPHRIGAKGAFGCSLGSHEILSVFQVLLLLLSFGILFFLRRGLKA